MVQIGWIDYSKEHRDRVMSILDMLSKPGAMDELGISVIRDALADLLFPGLSTLLTRAKYFLIVPWIMQDLERQNLGQEQFISRLHQQESEMILTLSKSESADVIGARAKESLKRKPSEIYWNGLRTYGIFRDERMSIGNYLSVAHKVYRMNQERRASLLNNNEFRDDDDAFAGEIIKPFWDVPKPPDNWKEHMTFSLTPEEAMFLRNKITCSPSSRDSLLAYILTQHASEACACTSFDALSALDMPAKIRSDYNLAKNFALLIFGAHIRYNIAFFRSIEQYEKADSLMPNWDRWVSEIGRFNLDSWNTDEMLYQLHISRGHHSAAFALVWIERYVKHLSDYSEDALDVFVTKQEIHMKGTARAKIGNWKQFDGNWIGLGKLEYRWPNTRQIITDIAAGLGDYDAATGA